MEKNLDTLVLIKQRIDSESKQGDKALACRKVGISATTYDRGFAKKTYNKLTDKELLVLCAHITILDERDEEEEKVRQASKRKAECA